jgi:zinc transport system substrate-binding protein
MSFLIRTGITLLICAWALHSPALGSEPLKVHVSILPQKYFVERIAEDLASVSVLVTPGNSPATYSPTPAQIKALTAADIYFRIGVPFENGFINKLPDIAPRTRVVETRDGIPLRDMEGHIHDFAPGGHASHGMGKDPHIWMSPRLVRKQAATMARILEEHLPAHAGQIQKNYAAFARDLDELDDSLSRILAPLKGRNLFVFHPAFGYFTDAYSLRQIPVETMGKSPRGKELAEIIRLARQENVRIIFVQPQFDRNTAETIATAIQGAVVSIDPLAEDYLNNMTLLAETIAAALAP